MEIHNNTEAQLKRELAEKLQQIAKLETKQKQREELLERCTRDISAFYRVTKYIGKANNLDSLAKTALDTVLAVGNLAFGVLYLLDKDTGESVLSFNTEISDELAMALARIPLVENIKTEVVETRQVTTSRDAPHDVRTADCEGQLLERNNIRGIIGVPLKSGDRIIGIIIAGAEYPVDLSNNDARLLEIAWVFDINFVASLKRIQQKGYIDQMFDLCPSDRPFQAAQKHIHDYITARINADS